jgi:hypothetical protein
MVVTILMTLVYLNATTDSDGKITAVQLAELHFHEIKCIHLLRLLVSQDRCHCPLDRTTVHISRKNNT